MLLGSPLPKFSVPGGTFSNCSSGWNGLSLLTISSE
jgi:hypothetical protein